MELASFVRHVADAIPVIDAEAETRPGREYLPGVGTLPEDIFRATLVDYLRTHHGDEYPLVVCGRSYRHQRAARCDVCVGRSETGDSLEWAIELKKVAFVGDNGKNNDFGPSKVVSPYRIHRSSVLDAERLQAHRPAQRGAVVMYGFDFDDEVVERGRAVCVASGIPIARVDALIDVLRRNGGDYLVEPTFRMFEQMPAQTHFRLGPREQARFGPLHRHPIFLKGHVAAWEVLDPESAS